MSRATNQMSWDEYQAFKRGEVPSALTPTPSSGTSPTTIKTKAQKAGWIAKKTWHNSPIVGLIRCRSMKEARRAAELDQMALAGELTAWWYETPLYCGFDNDDGSPVRMFPDFKLLWPNGSVTYQDTKGRKPEPDWVLRRKAVEQRHGITIEVI